MLWTVCWVCGALVWAGIVHLGKKQNWSGRKRHWMGFLAALLVAGAIGSAFAPIDQTPPPSAEASSPEPPESASKTETAASMDGDQQPVIGQGLGLSLDAYMSGINESIGRCRSTGAGAKPDSLRAAEKRNA